VVGASNLRGFIRRHPDACSSWQEVQLRNLEAECEPLNGEVGFEVIAQRLGIAGPTTDGLLR
jgi:hypothetical protein